MSLIGQFGVGFYSVFMVADKVVLTTKRLGSEEPAMRWESSGDGSYTLEESDKQDRGTELEIHIKEDEKEFLEDYRIRSIIRKYSEYITHPILLTDKDGKEEVLNDKPPIWRRSKSDITKEQYEEFYKHLAFDEEPPLAWTHNQVEGALEYTTLLYIPGKAPFDLYNPEKSNGLNLYVKRIFIMNDCKDLLPAYLRFARGIVDSEDLPLNVSREILQKNAVIQKINKAATKKVLQLLETMAKEEKDKYQKFWKEFGNVVKEGFHMNWENLDELKRLIRFQSSKAADGEFVGLEEYVVRMKAEQKDIYYISGETRRAVEHSPHLEVFKSKDIEVLYLIDPIDEWVVQSLADFDGKKLLNVAKGDLDLGELTKEEKKTRKEAEGKYKDFMKDFEEKACGHAEGGPRDLAPQGKPLLPGGGRDRHGRQHGTHPQDGEPEGGSEQAHPGNQSGSSHHAEPAEAVRGRCGQSQAQGLVRIAGRPVPARRRLGDQGSGRVRGEGEHVPHGHAGQGMISAPRF